MALGLMFDTNLTLHHQPTKPKLSLDNYLSQQTTAITTQDENINNTRQKS